MPDVSTDISRRFRRASSIRRSPAPRWPKAISKSLAKKAVAMTVDGELATSPIPIGSDRQDRDRHPRRSGALELIRHDAAHVMAEAVQALWPGTQVTIGPVIENGFYYDFARNEPFTPDDFAGIESEDARDHRARRALHQGGLAARARPRQVFETRARCSRSSWSTPSPRTRTSRSTRRATGSTSAAARTWPRPARSATPSS